MLYVSRVFQWERHLARMLGMHKCMTSYVQLKSLRLHHRRVCRWRYSGSTNIYLKGMRYDIEDCNQMTLVRYQRRVLFKHNNEPSGLVRSKPTKSSTTIFSKGIPLHSVS